ncbi:MAG: hypothetical protein K1X65_19570 [Caldilineales bacterium]|nr:hypothetical protein [Caldilineales bacterium]MCW5859359.1 hypothetical protein [Caldilineales bacterium]
MPTRSERIYLCPRDNGQPGWVMDFPAWWNRSGFFEKYGPFEKQGSRWFDTGNPWYVDYALLLTMSEAAAWDKQCRKAFAEDSRNQQAAIAEAMRLLAGRLDAAQWVIVESYEWESGLE